MAKNQCKVGENKSEIVRELPMACTDETAAVEFMEKHRWGESPCCPLCGSVRVYQMKSANGTRSARFLWRCHDCKKQYTVRIGTVMEDSRIPMRHWCYAMWAACASKKGVSAKQIQRQTGLSYKSSLFLMHRVRFAMLPAGDNGSKLTGTVECDETYVGGKPRHKGNNKRGRGTKKQPVMAMVERGGRVRTRVIADVTASTLKQAIRENVDIQARIMTDDNNSYRGLAREFNGGHFTTMHSSRQYVEPGTDHHSNTVEGFFSLLKRGVYGIWHNVSKKHLHRYCNEVAFRYTTRGLEDGERVVAAIKGGVGKRLMYRDQVLGVL